jgi:LysR family transcriptional regulator, low CO2-responsive transcriptional regulator
VRLRVVGNREQLVAMMQAGDVDLSVMGRPPKEIATRAAMETFFTEQRFEPRITMEMSSNETIKQAVMAGMGLSFLSLHTMGLEVRSGLLHVLDIEGTPLMKMWNVVHLQSRLLSPAAEAFRYFIIERGEAHLLAHDEPLLQRAAQVKKAARKRTKSRDPAR